MPKFDVPYDDLEDEIADVLKDPIIEIEGGDNGINLPALVRAPVATSPTGAGSFIQIDDLPDLDNLPFINERLRDFAFRYATEYHTEKDWAKEYNVTVQSIRRWVRHPGVRAYIGVSRTYQRTYNHAQRTVMNRRVYQTMNEILSTKLTADTIGPIVSMAKFCYKILNDPGSAGDRQKGVFNVNVGVQNNVPPTERTPYAQQSKISTVTPKMLSQMKRDIDELETLAADFNVVIDDE